jgi:hypothetical protein
MTFKSPEEIHSFIHSFICPVDQYTLIFTSEFILRLLSFVVENLDKFKINTDVHSLNTRRKHDLYMPNTNLTKIQVSSYSIIFHQQLKV